LTAAPYLDCRAGCERSATGGITHVDNAEHGVAAVAGAVAGYSAHYGESSSRITVVEDAWARADKMASPAAVKWRAGPAHIAQQQVHPAERQVTDTSEKMRGR
jgi:hypothetical protein